MVLLTKMIESENENIEIKIAWNWLTKTVEDVIHIWGIDKNRCLVFDLTKLSLQPELSGFYDGVIDRIDWNEIYTGHELQG